MKLVDLTRFDTLILQIFCRVSRRIDLISECLKTLGNLGSLGLVCPFDCNNHLFMLRQLNACAEECLIERFVKALGNS